MKNFERESCDFAIFVFSTLVYIFLQKQETIGSHVFSRYIKVHKFLSLSYIKHFWHARYRIIVAVTFVENGNLVSQPV